MKRVTFVIILGVCAFTLSAQTKWAAVTSQNDRNEICKGILLDNGNELIKPIYEKIYYTENHFYYLQNSNWGIIDSTGSIIIQPLYDSIGFGISDGLIRVKKNRKWGFLNRFGETVIDFKYEFACNFNDGKAYVIEKGQPMFIHKTGNISEITNIVKKSCPEDQETEEVIVSQFDIENSLSIIEMNNKFGVVDSTGKTVIPISFDEIGIYHNDVIEVRKGNLWGLFHNNGALIVEPKYLRIGLFTNWE